MKEYSHKALSIFGQGNISRVKQIVHSKNDAEELAKISPSFIVMDLTWRCNYHCSCCIDGNAVNRDSKDLPVEIIEDIFDYSNKRGVRGIMTMGGEVFLYKNGITKALEKSIEYQIPIKTVSNGSRLSEYIDLIVKAYKIPGSMLRISVNSDSEHYLEQTGGNVSFEEVFESIARITSNGTPVYVSTVIFPESCRKQNGVPNIHTLEKIIHCCEDAGVHTQILIPGRDPETRARYRRTDEEREIMEEIKRKTLNEKYKIPIGIEEFTKEHICKQNLVFDPCCPSGFIFTLIGSDGRVYKCTDNRGNVYMVLGKVEKPGDFERLWHSKERVERQRSTVCTNKSCIRYEINCLLNECMGIFDTREIDLTDYLEHEGGLVNIFI